MKKVIFLFGIILLLIIPVNASEISLPELPDDAEIYMPDSSEDFSQGLWHIIKSAIAIAKPNIAEAAGMCLSIIAITLLTGILSNISGMTPKVVNLAGAIGISVILMSSCNTMLQLGTDTVDRLSEYGRLLVPVLASAMAAQGGVTTASAIYTGTSVFLSIISACISRLAVPLIYIYTCLGIASGAIDHELLKKIKKFIKWLITWFLKIALYIFTGYMGITRVVSGSVDAASIKATKLTISGMVPVVGGIISDASETILVSAGLVKNSAGIYGLLAFLSLVIGPFFEIGIQYLMLKVTASVCATFSTKQTSALLQDFVGGMGMTLAMVATTCVLLLISVVCFLKGVG